ncbi:MAG: hypothetical protein OZ934_01715 [Anaerolineae bacterium]|nr:hypothetical protein [Anaerolineae bacterium]
MNIPSRTLILLDVDGVLVHPAGYKTALRTLVNRLAARLGQPPLGPTEDEIAVFEACGLTNEWDSGAMCVGALLLAALERAPALRRDTLEATFDAIGAAGLVLARPDFTAEARAIARHETDGRYPAVRYLELLSARTDPANLPLLRALLGNVYAVRETLTTRAFQTLALGSARFSATYNQPAAFACESYLATYDIALLNAPTRERLLGWASLPGHGATIFTARPSGPPADLPPGEPSGDPPSGFPPEAELAVELVGLAGKLPLIGQGRVGWLAWRNGRAAADYLKPSPVQALTAMGAALTGVETDALHAAAALVEHGEISGPLTGLREGSTRVIVCEDAAGGIRAVRGAASLLQRAGLEVSVVGVGVSPNADKRAALSAVADHLVDDVNEGLALVLDG